MEVGGWGWYLHINLNDGLGSKVNIFLCGTAIDLIVQNEFEYMIQKSRKGIYQLDFFFNYFFVPNSADIDYPSLKQ